MAARRSITGRSSTKVSSSSAPRGDWDLGEWRFRIVVNTAARRQERKEGTARRSYGFRLYSHNSHRLDDKQRGNPVCSKQLCVCTRQMNNKEVWRERKYRREEEVDG